ncbi:hypothetical protein CEP51_007635 [Fusarium floridanum]|uniref:Uncharacterized protein n=1 Tax=Fusarium floridanum TaxID=1325733 RepID=A0A428RNN8_9HYPO|nr:hypothetical protein CEP51_007635 [Fusarium floridanum]
MSSFGRLQAALAAATNEVTVAAANINFDFTLVKYEAPKEFQPLKGFLTTTRKHDAEAGKTHVIARRLGALFDGICPETPALIKAYGARVSEISKAATEKESRDYSKSIFAAYVGVDATSIWAAATSSKPAIHVHLLACMLAEICDAPEAVSIWVELVESRRRDIAQRLEQGEALHFGLASAAVQQEISRDQLAGWDASARAWIQTAKSVKNKEDRQLRIILGNVHYAVNAIDALYASVIDAWKLALETTENLILGMPQEAHNGAAILGLAAWHIYPDMVVYGKNNDIILMNDELVAHGGVLSLVNSESRQPKDRGVSWSLCLNHLKFYGPPARTEQTLEKEPRRISFKNLLHVTVGSILSRWQVVPNEMGNGVKLLVDICEAIYLGVPILCPPLNMLRTAAMECLNDEEVQRYLSYGNRLPSFIKDPDLHTLGSLKPFFGLLDLRRLLSCIPKEEDRISLLKRMTGRLDLAGQDVIIFDTSSSVAHHVGSESSPTWNAQDGYRKKRRPRSKQKQRKEFTMYGSQLFQGDGNSRSVFDFWFGDINSSAVFKKSIENAFQLMPPAVLIEDLLWCFKNGFVSSEAFVSFLDCRDPILQTVVCLYRASAVYNFMPRLSVLIRSIQKPLLDNFWAAEPDWFESLHSREGLKDTRLPAQLKPEVCMQLIAHLMCGYNIHSSAIPTNIMGISFEDSIFVPSKIVHDPAREYEASHVTQILGNIGRPGLVMLTSPANPMLAPLDEAKWRIYNMHEFNGKPENMLDATSLHLSFTNWSQPLNSGGPSGMQGAEALLVEAIVSIRDSGQWVGDVDAATALGCDMIYQVKPNPNCSHKPHSLPTTAMISIECWDELRICPEDTAGRVETS